MDGREAGKERKVKQEKGKEVKLITKCVRLGKTKYRKRKRKKRAKTKIINVTKEYNSN